MKLHARHTVCLLSFTLVFLTGVGFKIVAFQIAGYVEKKGGRVTHTLVVVWATKKLEVKNFGSLIGGEVRAVTRVVGSKDIVQVIFHLLRSNGLHARLLFTLIGLNGVSKCCKNNYPLHI